MKLMTRGGIRRIAFERLEHRDLLASDAFADVEFDFDSDVDESSAETHVERNADGDRDYRDDERADNDHDDDDTDDDDFDDDHNAVVSYSPPVQPQTTKVQPTSLKPTESSYDNGVDQGNESPSDEGESTSPASEDAATPTREDLAPAVSNEGDGTEETATKLQAPTDAAPKVVADQPPSDSRVAYEQAVVEANPDSGDRVKTSGDHEFQVAPDANDSSAATESSSQKSVDPIGASVQSAVADVDSSVAETTSQGFAAGLVDRVFRGGSLAIASLPTDFEAIDRVMNQLLDEIVAVGKGNGVVISRANLATVGMSATIGVIAVELVRRRGKLMRRDGAEEDALVWMFPEVSGLPGAGS